VQVLRVESTHTLAIRARRTPSINRSY